MKNGRPGQTLNAHLAGLRCYKLKRPAGTSTSMRSRSSSMSTKNSSTSGMSRGDCPSARSMTRRLCPGLSSTRKASLKGPPAHHGLPTRKRRRNAPPRWPVQAREAPRGERARGIRKAPSPCRCRPRLRTTAEVSSCGRISSTFARRGISSTGGTNATSMPSSSKKGRPDVLRTTSPPSRFFAVANQATSAQVRTIRQAPRQRGCRHGKPPREQACGWP